MCAKKFSESVCGKWVRTACGTPALELDASYLLATHPRITHALGSGHLRATASLLGRLALADVSHPDIDDGRVLDATDWSSAFTLRIACGGETRTFLLSNLSADEKPAVEWGVGHARYAAEIDMAGRRIHLSLTFAAPVQADYLVVEVAVENPDRQPLSLDLLAVVEHPRANGRQETPTTFKRETVAMFTNATAQGKDFFLAAPADWQLAIHNHMLFASNSRALAATERSNAIFLLGLRQDCSIPWAEGQLKAASVEGAQAEWAGMLDLTFPRFPEAWMKEECMWDVSRLLCGRRGRHLGIGDASDEGERTIVRGGCPAGAGEANALRNLLQLSLPLAYVNPELARNNLLHASASLQTCGRLGTFGGGVFRPERDVCDVEIWFVLAWCHFIRLTGDLRDIEAIDLGESGTCTLSDCLAKAFSWIESAIGTGAHGLLRAGAGDGFALLDAYARHGCGESFTATAQWVYALELWLALDAQLSERPPLAMEKARLWLPRLRDALADAFVDGAFVRGFDDQGIVFGCHRPDDRWFLDAQAWGLLAGCGSAEQRHTVLALLVDAAANDALPAISAPYEPPPPAALCRHVELPGCGLNGGIDSFTWACAIWAMAEAGARDAALAHWRHATLRHWMHAHDMPPFLPVEAVGTLPSRLLRAGRRTIGHAGASLQPDDAWLSWQHFALCKLLT